MTLRFQIRDPVQCHSLSLSLSSLSAREPVPFLNSAHACTSILADRPRPGIELHTRPSMCARAPVQFNMERKRTRKRPAELEEDGGRDAGGSVRVAGTTLRGCRVSVATLSHRTACQASLSSYTHATPVPRPYI